jgi:hypothetical protein
MSISGKIFILLALAVFACASTRSPDKTKPSRFGHLRGWRKIFGVLAVILTLFIILNPDFIALGLIGDSTFFDMLVLALSVQMSAFVAAAFRGCVAVLSRGVRWLGIPSPGLQCMTAVLIPVLICAVTTIQKAVHRILS